MFNDDLAFIQPSIIISDSAKSVSNRLKIYSWLSKWHCSFYFCIVVQYVVQRGQFKEVTDDIKLGGTRGGTATINDHVSELYRSSGVHLVLVWFDTVTYL